MTFQEFNHSVQSSEAPPADCGKALQALWWDAKGDWDRAHAAAQDEPGRDGAWVHAYLHRKEGDSGNAGYWYARAGRSPGTGSLDEERATIANALLGGR